MANFWALSATRHLDKDGNPASGAKMFVYLDGTLNDATYFLDREETSVGPGGGLHEANQYGIFQPIYLDLDTTYRIKVETSDGSEVLYDIEGIKGFDETQATEEASEAKADRILAEAARDAAQASEADAETARDEIITAADISLYTTWALLDAATGMSDGDLAWVLPSDTGDHTDPVYTGTVANAGVYKYSSSPAGWGRESDLESQLAEVARVAAVAAQTAAEAARDETQTLTDALKSPKGSIYFPRVHGSKSPDDFVALAMEDTTNFEGAFSESQSGFVAMVNFPDEATFGNFLYGLCGSDQNGAINFAIQYYDEGHGGSYPGQAEILIGGSGSGNTVADLRAAYPSGRHLIAARRDGTTWTLDFVDPSDPTTIIAGATVTGSTFTSVNQIRNDYWVIGGIAKGNTGPTSLANGWSDVSEKYWPGGIEFFGVSTVEITDAMLTAIAQGDDPAEEVGFGNWKFYREWTDGFTTESLSAPTRVTSDTTPALVKISGSTDMDIEDGPHLRPTDSSTFIFTDYIQRGTVFPRQPDSDVSAWRFQGSCKNLTGPCYVRFWDKKTGKLEAESLVGQFVSTDTTFDFDVTDLPLAASWSMGELWVPDSGVRFAFQTDIASGDVGILHSQSQGTRLIDTDGMSYSPDPSRAMSLVFNVDEDKNAAGQQGKFQRYIIGRDEGGISDGLYGMARWWDHKKDGSFGFVVDGVSGVSSLPWLVEPADAPLNIPRLNGTADIEITTNTADIWYVSGREWQQSIDLFEFACQRKPTCWVFNQYSADNTGEFWIEQNMKPVLHGNGGGWVDGFTHFVLDGTLFANTPHIGFVQVDRHVGGDGAAIDSGHEGGGSIGYGIIRDAVREFADEFGYTYGPYPGTLGAELIGGAEDGPHVREDQEPGQGFYGELVMESFLRCLGYSTTQDPYIKSVELNGLDELVFTIECPNGGGLRTYSNNTNSDGYVIVDGFEINETNSGTNADWEWMIPDNGWDVFIRGSNQVVLKKDDGSNFPSDFAVCYLYGGPLYSAGGSSDDDRVRDLLYERHTINQGVGMPVMGSQKEWTTSDLT